ncbi:MAG: hypothetical protein AAGI71_08830 [Bacteroidota bacterium]
MLARCCLLILLSGLALSDAFAQVAADRIYGTITTRDGGTFEGLIRWDNNEASWVDVIDGNKMIMDRTARSGQRSVRVFGIEVTGVEDRDNVRSSAAGIRFGHLESLENIGSNRALFTLRSGQQVEFRGGTTDIGNGNRGIMVEDPNRGEVELRWRDIERIDFAQAPDDARSRYGERLYGRLVTQRGLAFTGYICWDMDELLGDDVLDGEDEDEYDRKIRFSDLLAIEHNSNSSARVELRNGETLVLRGSNDVNRSNSDILVLDPLMGQVRVPWEAFERVDFMTPDEPTTYRSFPGADALRGTVFTREGAFTRDDDRFDGPVRWGDDKSHAWELLNGELGDLTFDIEMGLVAEIERLSSRSALVMLRDGRTFELDGSHDVNKGNDGIFVLISEDTDEYRELRIRIPWRDFDRIVFDKP